MFAIHLFILPVNCSQRQSKLDVSNVRSTGGCILGERIYERNYLFHLYISILRYYLILGMDNMYIMKFIYLNLFYYSDNKIRLMQSDFDARCIPARAVRAINFIQMDRFERLYIYHNYTRVAAQRR